MGKLLTKKQRIELIAAHRLESNSRFSDRIKAVLLLDSDWPVNRIAEALLLDSSTIRRYKDSYESGGIDKLCSDAYIGRMCSLTDQEKSELEQELRSRIYLSTSEIVSWIKQRFNVRYSISGVTYLLHSMGFSYKKPSLVPGKANEEAQREFLDYYRKIKKAKKSEDKLFFGDGVHPQHNSLPSYGWLPKGEEIQLKSNTGRQRVNISGALDADTLEVVVKEHDRLNAETTISFFRHLEDLNRRAKKIYLILDNAGYYKGKKIREYLKTSRIKLIFLPPYAPNLNLIERLWKFFKKQVLYNRYYETFQQFKSSCMEFFKKSNLRKHRKQLASILTDNFHIVGA